MRVPVVPVRHRPALRTRLRRTVARARPCALAKRGTPRPAGKRDEMLDASQTRQCPAERHDDDDQCPPRGSRRGQAAPQHRCGRPEREPFTHEIHCRSSVASAGHQQPRSGDERPRRHQPDGPLHARNPGGGRPFPPTLHAPQDRQQRRPSGNPQGFAQHGPFRGGRPAGDKDRDERGGGQGEVGRGQTGAFILRQSLDRRRRLRVAGSRRTSSHAETSVTMCREAGLPVPSLRQGRTAREKSPPGDRRSPPGITAPTRRSPIAGIRGAARTHPRWESPAAGASRSCRHP